MRQPKVLFFDEPTSALDTQNIDEVVKLIKELAKESYSIIIVTHDLKFVEKLNCTAFNLAN